MSTTSAREDRVSTTQPYRKDRVLASLVSLLSRYRWDRVPTKTPDSLRPGDRVRPSLIAPPGTLALINSQELPPAPEGCEEPLAVIAGAVELVLLFLPLEDVREGDLPAALVTGAAGFSSCL